MTAMRTRQTEEEQPQAQLLARHMEIERKCDANPIVPAHGRQMLEPSRSLRRSTTTLKAL